MTIKDRIKLLADKEDISLTTLEKRLGFGSSTIVKWSTQSPSIEKLTKVADYFGVSLDWLAGRENDNSTPDIKSDSYAKLVARDGKKIPKSKVARVQTLLDAAFEGEISLVYTETKK